MVVGYNGPDSQCNCFMVGRILYCQAATEGRKDSDAEILERADSIGFTNDL